MDTVDRINRDKLADAICDFMEERINAFEFDERVFDIRAESEDETVDKIAVALWFHYDDVRDHKVSLSKEEWDYFYRLILLLRSDARLESGHISHPSFSQVLASIGLTVFIGCALQIGVRSELLIVAIPFGMYAGILHLWRRRFDPEPSRRELAMMPFASLSELLRVRRSVAGFVKCPYPGNLQKNRPWSRGFQRFLNAWAFLRLAMCGPLVLFAQMFPVRQVNTRVVLP